MKKISERPLFVGNWLSLHELIFETNDGAEIAWEAVRRRNAPIGVVVIAKMVPSKRFILIKQFRPAVNGYVLSFVAGLAKGDPRQAVRELREETGYIGKIISVSPALKTGSSIIDDSGKIIYVEVDEKDPRNKDPKQHLEAGEEIQVCLVSKKEAEKFLHKERRKGTFIGANVWYIFGVGKFI